MCYLVEVDYLVFHKYEEDVSGNQDDLGDVDEDTEDDHEDGVDQEARQMTISDIDSWEQWFWIWLEAWEAEASLV